MKLDVSPANFLSIKILIFTFTHYLSPSPKGDRPQSQTLSLPQSPAIFTTMNPSQRSHPHPRTRAPPPPSMTQPPTSTAAARKRARSLKRLHRHKQHSDQLPADVALRQERELQSLDHEVRMAAERRQRKSMIGRYHMVRFFGMCCLSAP